ncbi:GHMP kinase [Candidatus Woesearchaeota archaeon]|nr:GHMP kinase [Candidatus Woesearchaeota archaeon]
MIISRTPLRISFVGGGTDIRNYYELSGGSVISTAINKYVYITINKRFDDTIRVSYSKTEITNNVDKIKHDIVRETMKAVGITKGVEITSIADVPAHGTGLGSSSAFTVGLLNALYAYKGHHKSAKQLAEDACKIEIDILKEPIGKQDQYICAYGGFQHIIFNQDNTVLVNHIICNKNTVDKLQDNLMMFYTGILRRSNTILSEQVSNVPHKKAIMDKMTGLTYEMKDLLNNNYIDKFGKILLEGWNHKKQLASGITNDKINKYYEKAINAGASGGKLLGAGGGGFLLIYCEKNKQYEVRKALSRLREFPFSFEQQGSRIIYVGD